MAFINVIEPEDADGRLLEVYDDLLKSRGKIAEVHKIQSLNPESIVNHMDLYLTIMFGKSPLKRYQREMMAVVVSKANNCEYCQTHHSTALNHFWKDDAKTALLKEDYTQVALSEEDAAWCDLAWNTTKHPGVIDHQQQMMPLKQLGVADRAILDAILVISYFNFVNRIVLGLGVHLEKDMGVGYKYD